MRSTCFQERDILRTHRSDLGYKIRIGDALHKPVTWLDQDQKLSYRVLRKLIKSPFLRPTLVLEWGKRCSRPTYGGRRDEGWKARQTVMCSRTCCTWIGSTHACAFRAISTATTRGQTRTAPPRPWTVTLVSSPSPGPHTFGTLNWK